MYKIVLQKRHFQISGLPENSKAFNASPLESIEGIKAPPNPTAYSSNVSLPRRGALLTRIDNHNISVAKYLYGLIL